MKRSEFEEYLFNLFKRAFEKMPFDTICTLLRVKGFTDSNWDPFEESVPGGYTSGFWRKGFYFESGTLSFESSEHVFQVMKDIGVHDRLPFTRQYGRWIFRWKRSSSCGRDDHSGSSPE